MCSLRTVYKLTITTLYAIIVLLLLVESFTVNGQVFETELDPEEGARSSVLDQASASFTGASPSLTLKTYKLKGLIGKGSWDLYLFNTVAALSVKRQDSLQVLADDILNQLGGLLNFSLSKVGYFANGKDIENRDIKGGQMDFRFGGKLIDSRNRELNSNFTIPIFQTTMDVRYLIPLVATTQDTDEDEFDIKNLMKGNLSFRLYGSFMQIFNTKVYDEYYRTKQGILPTHSLFSVSGEVNIFISNQLYLSAGYTLSNQPTLPSRSFFSVSYTGQGGR